MKFPPPLKSIFALTLLPIVLLGGCKTDEFINNSLAISSSPQEPKDNKISILELCKTPNLLQKKDFEITWDDTVSDLTKLPDFRICFYATNFSSERWVANGGSFVIEAERRGFDAEDCVKIWSGKDYSKITHVLFSIDKNIPKEGYERNYLEAYDISPNQCAAFIGLKIPKSKSEYSAKEFCKEFEPFLVEEFAVSFKNNEIAEELQKRKISPQECMIFAEKIPPLPLVQWKAEDLCKKYTPFVAGKFKVRIASGPIGDEISRRKISAANCMKYAGMTPPKALKEYSWEDLCRMDSSESDVRSELSRRKILDYECNILREATLSSDDYLTKTPSKRITPYLADLDLCRFLKFRKPPHLQAAVSERKLRCDRLLSLDEFERSVN